MKWGTVGADELSATLWRERRQLDFLLFLLETQLLHLRAGNWHRLNFTASELEKVIENLRFESLARGVEASALAAEWKAPDQLTLPALISIAPPAIWPELLEDHRRGMAALLADIDDAVSANVALLQAPPSSGPAAGSELAGTGLAGSDLAGSDLAGTGLAGSDLAGSDLAGSGLAGSELAGTDDLALLARDANVQRALAAVRTASLPTLRDFLGLG